MNSPIQSQRTVSHGQRASSDNLIQPDAHQQPSEIHRQSNSSARSDGGALAGARQVRAPVLQPSPIPAQNAAPTVESVERRDQGVLTEWGLLGFAGAPKERRSFLGLFRFGGQRSQEYRQVLRSVTAFSELAHDDTQALTEASVDAAIAQLDQVSANARAYVEGRRVLTRKSQMRELITDAEQEKAALEQLKSAIEQGQGLPPNISLRELLPYLRRGVTPEAAIRCYRDGTKPSDVLRLASDNVQSATVNVQFIEVASWLLARSQVDVSWSIQDELLNTATMLVDCGLTRADLDALDQVLGRPTNLEQVDQRIDTLDLLFGRVLDDQSKLPQGSIARLLNAIQKGGLSLLRSGNADDVEDILEELLPLMPEHPDLPAYIESGLQAGLLLQDTIDWAQQPQSLAQPTLQGALSLQCGRVGAFGAAEGASPVRWQAIAQRLQTDDAYRIRVCVLTLGLSPGLQQPRPLAQALLFAEHGYSDEQIRVWLATGTRVSDVLLPTPLQADQVQGAARTLGAGAFNTVLALRYGDDAASAREYAFKPLKAGDKTGYSHKKAGVKADDPQVLARNMASVELARRLGMASLIPESRPGFYRDDQGVLQMGVVMDLAVSTLADKKTLLREKDISDSGQQAALYLQATAQLATVKAVMSPAVQSQLEKKEKAAFQELRNVYPNLTSPSDLQIREVNGVRRLFATVSQEVIPDPAEADPALQEALMSLQLLDYLLLQVDRHLNNFMIQRDATGATLGVVGFDNDQCLGTLASPDHLLALAPRLADGKRGPAHFLGRPPVLSEQQIQVLQNFDAQGYRQWLEAAGFSPEVIAAFDDRLQRLLTEAQAAAQLGVPGLPAGHLRKVAAFDDASREWLLGAGRTLVQPGWRCDNSLWRSNRRPAAKKRPMAEYLNL
jgi:hypothetical protein